MKKYDEWNKRSDSLTSIAMIASVVSAGNYVLQLGPANEQE